MIKHTGASAKSDQALAVPAEPVTRLGPLGFDPSRDVADALKWLDLHFQFRGQFSGAAKVQQREPEMVGVAWLMARYKAGAGAHEATAPSAPETPERKVHDQQ